MIPQEILLQYNATIKSFDKDAIIFSQNQTSKYYYQIVSGVIKMNNYNDDGKEFIQGIFYKNQSFGEPPLFIDSKYPANAVTLTESKIILLYKKDLFLLLKERPKIHINIIKNLAERLYYKAIIASEISNEGPSHRVLRFIDYLKHDVYKTPKKFTFKIKYTRQQLGDILGLRVETVIRAVKNLEKKGEIKIIKRKIFR